MKGSDQAMKKRIITIARQYGSRGREIGKKIVRGVLDNFFK